MRDGYTKPLHCKGVGEPAFIVKYRGRWWRTKAARDVTIETMDEIKRLGSLPYGLVKFNDYCRRSGKTFNDLPLLERLH